MTRAWRAIMAARANSSAFAEEPSLADLDAFAQVIADLTGQ
jgi:hypothetical protein